MQESSSAKKQSTKLSIGSKAVYGLIATIIMIVAIFPLSSLAETIGWYHYLQHVLIFLAGTILGATVFSDYFKFNKSR